MYIVLLTFIIHDASCEWVEITQQRYRKPFITQIGTKTTERSQEDVTYFNNSVFNKWNDIHRSPNSDKIKLVNFPTGNVNLATGEAFTIETMDTSESSDEFGFTEEIPFTKIDYGSIKRVPNLGSVERVHLNKSPVRTPILKPIANTKGNPPVRFLNSQKNADEDELNLGSFGLYNTKIKAEPDKDVAEHKMSRDRPILLANSAEIASTVSKKRIQTSTARYRYLTDNFKNKQDKDATKNNFTTVKDGIHFSENINSNLSTVYHNYNKENQIKSIIAPSNVTKPRVSFEEKKQFDNKNKETTGANNTQTDKSNSKGHSNVKTNQSIKKEDEKKDNIKVNSVENVMKVMKVVADTISENTRRSVGSKMQYLEDLKDTILYNIAYRIDATWPDDDEIKRSGHRQSRSAQDTARGHVEFPSSESSLMTISFLTFAVFLIKLVLQVIQTYKHKTMMVAPLVVAAAGRAGFKKIRDRNFDPAVD